MAENTTPQPALAANQTVEGSHNLTAAATGTSPVPIVSPGDLFALTDKVNPSAPSGPAPVPPSAATMPGDNKPPAQFRQ
jgi:hypothetical protein